MKRIIVLLLMFGLSFAIFTGCSKTEKETTPEQVSEQTEEKELTENTEELGWPRTIIDGFGREITLEKKPERIVVSFFNDVDWLLTFDVMPIGSGGTEYLEEYKVLYTDKNTDNIEEIGGENAPNWEKITELKPDLIFLEYWQEDLAEIASEISPTYVFKQLEGNDWIENTNAIGEIFGDEEKAKKIIAETSQTITDTREKLRKYKDKSFVFLRTNGIADIYLLGSNQNAHQEDGLGLSAPKGYPSKTEAITLEGLLELDPDYIILQSGQENNEIFEQHIQESRVGQSLKAFKDGHIIKMSDIVTGDNPNIIKYFCGEMLKVVGE